MNKRRITILKNAEQREGPVVYWMSRDQRAQDNWALLFAQELALHKKEPLIVVFTLVEQLYAAGEYRPPWLWSVVDVIRQGREILSEDSLLLCHPSGGGSKRGPHNCGKCDHKFLEAISDFSLTNHSYHSIAIIIHQQ